MRASTGQIVFGPFCLDTETPRLLRDGIELELRPQALHALRTLLLNSGRCVDYSDMIGEAWHGISVSRHTVAVTVGEVKRALREYGGWISYHPRLGYRLDIPQSDDLIRSGWHFWQRHTREGFEKALECFEHALDESGMAFRAWEGISRSYLMLGTFAMRCPREMYARFLDAHSRAVELGGLTPELRADRAQGLHVFELKFKEAEEELLQAQHENPRSAGVCIRLAVLYATMKRFEEALAAVNQAYVLDSLWPILPAAELLIRCALGDFETAVRCGKKALDLHPYLSLGRSHYAQALEFSGNPEEALVHYHMAAVISPDLPRLRAEEARCLARLGRFAEATAILHELEELQQREYVDGYIMSFLYESLGHIDKAVQSLERAAEDGSPILFLLDVDQRMDGLRCHPCFKRIRNKVFEEMDRYVSERSSKGVLFPQFTPKPDPQRHRIAS
jgi:tetratricopeptide (TPR) repeat protein